MRLKYFPKRSDSSNHVLASIILICFLSACLFAAKPPIIDPDSTFSLPYECGYSNFRAELDVIDEDGDSIIVETNIAKPVMTDFYIDGDDISHWIGYIDFDRVDFCGDVFEGDLEITATDEEDSTDFAVFGPLIIVGKLTVSMEEEVGIWPGEEDWMPLYIDAAECFCLGGFVFVIAYEDSCLEVTDVMPGQAIENGEFFDIIYEAYGPGTLKVIFINDLNNPDTAPEICEIDPEEPILYIKFLLYGDLYPPDFPLPVVFYDEEPNYNFNSVCDTSGEYIWFSGGCDSIHIGMELELFDGSIILPPYIPPVWGDINLNRYPYEAGDAVLLVNYLIDPESYPFTLRQLFNSDVNHDGFYATVADLTWIINIICGIENGKVTPFMAEAVVSMPVNTYGNVDVMIGSEASIGGALVKINHSGIELGEPFVDGMDIKYKNDGDILIVLIYSWESNSLAPGSNILFTIPVLSEGSINIEEVSISDNRGALLEAHFEHFAPVPSEFTVYQNYPNPFNAKTNIKFSLPTEADVEIEIFNTTGQLVEVIDLGLINAGYKSIFWDASDVASGAYYYKITADDYSQTKKMLLLK